MKAFSPPRRLTAAFCFSATALTTLSAASSALACACGCGVFGVGTASLLPSGSGGQAFVEYDYMDQKDNRSGTARAPAADNDDKDIETSFFTVGGQYMFNRSWGVTVSAPYWARTFKTDDGGGVGTFKHSAFGDVRLTGTYTGFSADMSTGLIFGLKLPTGDFKAANFDRDTQIGTGSTDLLLGGYHLGPLTADRAFTYFAQGMWDHPVASQGGYKPGQEVNASLGVYYNGVEVPGGQVKISPVLQLIASARARDTGPEANPTGSGYSRTLISPGVELSSGEWKLYGDVGFPIYQHVNGDQLTAPVLFKLILSRGF